MRSSPKAIVYAVAVVSFILLNIFSLIVTGRSDGSMTAGCLIMTFLYLGELVSNPSEPQKSE